MNKNNALVDRFIEKITLSLALTGALYLYTVYRALIVGQIAYVINEGSNNFGTSIKELMQQYMNNIFPIVVFWLLLGVLCYFFYFILQNVYYHVENAATIKLFFTKPIILRRDNDKMFFIKRIGVHALVIACFLLFILPTVFGLIPISTFVQRGLESFSTSSVVFILSIVASVLYWYLIATIMHIVAVRLNDAVVCTELEAEHDSALSD